VDETTTPASRLTRTLRRLPSAAVISKFLLTGAVVGGTHLGLVTVAVLLGVPIQIALAASFIIALLMHFTLNRQWVFAAESGYALHFTRQGLRYVVVAAVSYAGTATSVALLPSLLGLPELAVFFLATCAMASVSFVALNFWVFRAAPGR